MPQNYAHRKTRGQLAKQSDQSAIVPKAPCFNFIGEINGGLTFWVKPLFFADRLNRLIVSLSRFLIRVCCLGIHADIAPASSVFINGRRAKRRGKPCKPYTLDMLGQIEACLVVVATSVHMTMLKFLRSGLTYFGYFHFKGQHHAS